jgi:hypothetical protein
MYTHLRTYAEFMASYELKAKNALLFRRYQFIMNIVS